MDIDYYVAHNSGKELMQVTFQGSPLFFLHILRAIIFLPHLFFWPPRQLMSDEGMRLAKAWHC
jgi:hypothetical protein